MSTHASHGCLPRSISHLAPPGTADQGYAAVNSPHIRGISHTVEGVQGAPMSMPPPLLEIHDHRRRGHIMPIELPRLDVRIVLEREPLILGSLATGILLEELVNRVCGHPSLVGQRIVEPWCGCVWWNVVVSCRPPYRITTRHSSRGIQ